jgi:hypothetical protein
MLFISLANCLTGDTVRNWFQSHPLVLRGRRIVADYRWPAYGPNISVFTLQPRPPDLAAAGRR